MNSNPDYFLNNLVFIAPAILQSDSIVTLFKMLTVPVASVSRAELERGFGPVAGTWSEDSVQQAQLWTCIWHLSEREIRSRSLHRSRL